MNRKIIAIVFVGIILLILAIFFLRLKGINKISSNPNDPDFYTYNNSKVFPGFTYVTTNGQSGRIIGKLTDVKIKDKELVGYFDFQVARSRVIVFSPDFPTELDFQGWRNFGYPQNITSAPRSVTLDSKDKAFSELNSLIGRNVVITLILKDDQINKGIIACNSSFVEDIKNNTVPKCMPQSFRLSVYKP